MSNVYRCRRCLNMSTRPRIEFDDNGYCNACQWAAEKEHIDWEERQAQLHTFIRKHGLKSREYGCIVPVSGGKDSSYVAHMIKHKLGIHPLCITVNPPLSFTVGRTNLENFSNAGYDLLEVVPNPEIMRRINKIGLLESGLPLLGWQLAVQAYIPKLAVKLNIPMIMYGEDGEVEYGGRSNSKDIMSYTVSYSKEVYLAGAYTKVLAGKFNERDLAMFSYPSDEQIAANNVAMMHWSFFEPWDSYAHYTFAQEHFGLQEKDGALEVGTYKRDSQNDTCLYDLHTYLMFLKFGFGRATQDAGIDIRRSAMTRDEGIELVKKHDDWRPDIYFAEYCAYYEIMEQELVGVFDAYANKELLHKVNGRWVLREEIF